MAWPKVVSQWGSTAEERARAYPCDRLVDGPHRNLYRAVDVAAPQEVVFRWLCQLRAAPYSYDKLDNFGRRSPQELTPGLERLEVGQRVATIFRLVEFERGESLTILHRGRVFGEVACTYWAKRVGGEHSRIAVKLCWAPARGRVLGSLERFVLPPGDLVMMRRQLLNLKALAERTARGPSFRPDAAVT
ncbi:MAG TPA: hypothetical protein VFK14_07625 [Solirubrobacterales bacterium]|nr:hypothetical protein [Solirubrobacterales bacterium]